jgi:hypothetical protein
LVADMSRPRAADDFETIGTRQRELDAERVAARNPPECPPHNFPDWSAFCRHCGLSREAWVRSQVAAAEGG